VDVLDMWQRLLWSVNTVSTMKTAVIHHLRRSSIISFGKWWNYSIPSWIQGQILTSLICFFLFDSIWIESKNSRSYVKRSYIIRKQKYPCDRANRMMHTYYYSARKKMWMPDDLDRRDSIDERCKIIHIDFGRCVGLGIL
jgi:hypothetical protein